MTDRQRLLALVDELPEAEVHSALRFLEYLGYDDEHSANEDRWITQSRSAQGAILIVVHTFDEQSDGTVAVRIISARRATRQER
jgi:uncharacterized DUF497 family protein